MLSKLQYKLIKAIAEESIYSRDVIEDIFNIMKSFDRTLTIIETAAKNNLEPVALAKKMQYGNN